MLVIFVTFQPEQPTLQVLYHLMVKVHLILDTLAPRVTSLVDGGAANLQRFTGDAIIKIDAEL